MWKYRRNYYSTRWKKVPTVRDFDFLYGFILLWFLVVIWNAFTDAKQFFTYLGTLLLWMIVSVWTFFLLKQYIRNKRYSSISSLEDMHRMSPRDFELFIEFILKRKWFSAMARKGTRDGGIDIDAKKNGRKYIVQCKRYSRNKVTSPQVRDLFWATMWVSKDAKSIIITTSELTQDAVIFAKKNDMDIWDKNFLAQYISGFHQWVDLEPTAWVNANNTSDIKCPRCNAHMVERVARKWLHIWKKFYGCSRYPECEWIVDIK